MSEIRKLSRRSFLGKVVGGAAVGALAITVGATEAQAQTDSDPYDPIGGGRGRRTGITDSDRGANADPAGNGRGGRRSGITDSDSGANADPAGNGRGRGRTGLTDSDSGGWADPAGNGRGGRRRCPTGLTDRDSGSNADPARCGRGTDH